MVVMRGKGVMVNDCVDLRERDKEGAVDVNPELAEFAYRRIPHCMCNFRDTKGINQSTTGKRVAPCRSQELRAVLCSF